MKTVQDFWHEFHNNPSTLDDLRYHVRDRRGITEYASSALYDVIQYVGIRNVAGSKHPDGPVTAWAKIELLGGPSKEG